MKRILSATVLLMFLASPSVFAQKMMNGKVIMETKEWRVDGEKRRLDHHTKYNAEGDRIEEIEYSSVGDQKSRVTYKYNEKGKCIEEQHYDEFNKLEKTILFEYNEFNRKKLQKTLLPNGKVKGVKEFEYVLAD